MLNLLVADDDLPELAESFQVTLVSARSGDGKPGSTPTSGASIDPSNSVNTVTVTASDHPYGDYCYLLLLLLLVLFVAINLEIQLDYFEITNYWQLNKCIFISFFYQLHRCVWIPLTLLSQPRPAAVSAQASRRGFDLSGAAACPHRR